MISRVGLNSQSGAKLLPLNCHKPSPRLSFGNEIEDKVELSSTKTEEPKAEEPKTDTNEQTASSANTSEASASAASTTASTPDKPIKKDKINWNTALTNFGKGVISPITTFFSSTTSMAIGAGVTAALVVIQKSCKNKDGHSPVGVVLVAAGLLSGAYNIVRGIRKFMDAKDHVEKEKSFYDIGTGASIAGVAAYSANSALKSAGITIKNAAGAQIKNPGIFKAAKECIVKTPKCLQDTVSKLDISKVLKAFTGGGEVEVAESGVTSLSTNKLAPEEIADHVGNVAEQFSEMVSNMEGTPALNMLEERTALASFYARKDLAALTNPTLSSTASKINGIIRGAVDKAIKLPEKQIPGQMTAMDAAETAMLEKEAAATALNYANTNLQALPALIQTNIAGQKREEEAEAAY